MRFKSIFVAFAFAVSLAFVAGCGGQKTPPDMPKLQPTTIVITQDGAPCEGASVQLVKPDDLNYKWLAGGVTDAQGRCEILTHGKYKGAPEGEFAVIVYKTIKGESETRKNVPEPTDPKEAMEWNEKVAAEETATDEIDQKYKKADTTDLRITVKSGKNEETFEVGPKVSIAVEAFR
ncbi:MAG: hypothetical protein IJO06_03825 [Thermoguttaceae bacterium]|nr:hypothetical protein [Thermoguttaceae bacterium]